MIPPRIQNDLWSQVLNAWEDLVQDRDYFSKFVDSISHRVRAVVEADADDEV